MPRLRLKLGKRLNLLNQFAHSVYYTLMDLPFDTENEDRELAAVREREPLRPGGKIS